jgi:hypothetical protein
MEDTMKKVFTAVIAMMIPIMMNTINSANAARGEEKVVTKVYNDKGKVIKKTVTVQKTDKSSTQYRKAPDLGPFFI